MGYNTKFQLYITFPKEPVLIPKEGYLFPLEIKSIDDICSFVENNESMFFDFYSLRECLINAGGVYAKWYESDEDMIKLSENMPGVLFELSGHGEEYDDLWITYYKNGKRQHTKAIIVYEEFDEKKMV